MPFEINKELEHEIEKLARRIHPKSKRMERAFVVQEITKAIQHWCAKEWYAGRDCGKREAVGILHKMIDTLARS